MTEKDLLFKLITTGHLNVAERRLLPHQYANKKMMIEIIVNLVSQQGKFPNNLTLNDDFDGGLIIKRSDDLFEVYYKAEKSVGNYEVVSKTSFDNSHKAANYFLEFYNNSIDGIEFK